MENQEQANLEFAKAYELQRSYFFRGEPKKIEVRKQVLITLRDQVKKNEEKIIKALQIDLGRNPFESFLLELFMFYQELDESIAKVKKWSDSKSISCDLVNLKSSNFLKYEPFGQVLIIAPWNYPFQLLFVPLIGALSAGNVVIMKPSREVPTCYQVFREIINKSLPAEHVYLVSSLIDNKTLMQKNYDFICFTGMNHSSLLHNYFFPKHMQ